MHVMIISGSRNPEGQTARCADAIASGLAKAGATSETVFLPVLDIKRCRQCDADGWGFCKSEMRCIIEDDFASLMEKINATDAVVFTNPVYFKDLSESLRGFLDRLRRITFFNHQSPLRGKPVLGVCLAGGGRGEPPACFHLERILTETGFAVLNVIPVRRQNIESRLPVLEKAGERLVNNPRPGTFSRCVGALTRKVVGTTIHVAYQWLGRWRLG